MSQVQQNITGTTPPHPHRLWWKPRVPGKGILYRSGHVHTWPEDEGDHGAISQQHEQQTGDKSRMFFNIRPDGKVRVPARHARHYDELSALLTAADGRLSLFNPHHAEPARAEPSERDRALWLKWQLAGARR